MLKPRAVRPPAVVGIVAPASPVQQGFVERGIAELSRIGFEARLARSLYERGRYTAGTPDQRRADFVDLWEDPEVSAIFCARGGYGSVEILEGLDPERLRRHPKLLLGASDVTALLSYLGAKVGLVSFHGPMVAQKIARADYDADNLLQLLGATEPGLCIPLSGASFLHQGVSEGTLWGGCLSVLTSLVGTDYLPSFEDAVLFLEDVQVKPYQIDRMLTQLRLSHVMQGVRGIIFGQMADCEQHPDQGYTLAELLRDLTAPLGLPVAYGFPSGHTLSPAMTLPFGVRVRLDDAGITLLEGAVS